MTPDRSFLPEIQGLRAVAVALVVIFHIWPSSLPGGYVGVDVFFVISGYLITGLLVRIAMRDGRLSLLDFYSRRARRLLPVATLVLAATFIGMFVFLPEGRWDETSIQIAASALYVQNWVLAWLSVDYLGAENVASPVQHFWSLSIEEQFYFVWPLVMIGALAVAHRFGFSLRRVFVAGLGAIFVASFAASVILTAQDPAQAYFVTHTRMWELALGGLLALTIHRFEWVRRGFAPAILVVGGLAAIVWSAAAYSPATPFPGVAALVPTLGTALIIIAGDVRLGVFRGLNANWLTYIGDRSYSIYLWHWPLIVFYMVREPEIGLMDGIGLIALTLALSHLSYAHVEQRYRHARAKGEWRPIAYGLASVFACVAAVGALQYSVASRMDATIDPNDPNYPGPAALLASAPVPEGVELVPAIGTFRRDIPLGAQLGCHQDQEKAEALTCTLGDPDSDRVIVIMGDSHAGQWTTALDLIAEEAGFRFHPFTKSACPFSRVQVQLGGGRGEYTSCWEWRENVLAELADLKPEIIFTSQLRRGSGETLIEGTQSVWRDLLATGARVINIEDTPRMSVRPEDCVSAAPEECTTPREEAIAPQAMQIAGAAVPEVEQIDLVDAFCDVDQCPVVIGNVIAWRDQGHITSTYSAMLASYLAELSGLPLPAGRLGRDVAVVSNGSVIRATLECGPGGGSAPFSRPITVEIADGSMTYQRGDSELRQNSFDFWTGTLADDGAVTMTGSYREGAGGIRDVEFSGQYRAGQSLNLEGKRGPRDCSIRLQA